MSYTLLLNALLFLHALFIDNDCLTSLCMHDLNVLSPESSGGDNNANMSNVPTSMEGPFLSSFRANRSSKTTPGEKEFSKIEAQVSMRPLWPLQHHLYP
jgi:hypothetical protein